MATTHPRVQVTVDLELAEALAEVSSSGPKSRVIRDLAVRGAEALRVERVEREEALRFLVDELDDPERYDLSEARRLYEQR